MAEADLNLLARQQQQILAELADIRDDQRVLLAMVQRLDGTVTGLVGEVRATHAP